MIVKRSVLTWQRSNMKHFSAKSTLASHDSALCFGETTFLTRMICFESLWFLFRMEDSYKMKMINELTTLLTGRECSRFIDHMLLKIAVIPSWVQLLALIDLVEPQQVSCNGLPPRTFGRNDVL